MILASFDATHEHRPRLLGNFRDRTNSTSKQIVLLHWKWRPDDFKTQTLTESPCDGAVELYKQGLGRFGRNDPTRYFRYTIHNPSLGLFFFFNGFSSFHFRLLSGFLVFVARISADKLFLRGLFHHGFNLLFDTIDNPEVFVSMTRSTLLRKMEQLQRSGRGHPRGIQQRFVDGNVEHFSNVTKNTRCHLVLRSPCIDNFALNPFESGFEAFILKFDLLRAKRCFFSIENRLLFLVSFLYFFDHRCFHNRFNLSHGSWRLGSQLEHLQD
mmetsp:Transcript_8502/g.16224  ORF Transcript_8502/g.16224 Transcript_8502/m.16224 type:complete len:269 (+) Transcript_8502:7799-8605(+)